MARNIFSFVISLLVLMVSTISCTDEDIRDTRSVTSIDPVDPVVTGTKVVKGLTHDINNLESKVTDNMVATAEIQSLENGEVVSSYVMTQYPFMEASLKVMKNDYTITEDQINAEQVSLNILRNQHSEDLGEGGVANTDTVVIALSDGQLLKAPSTISTYVGYYKGDSEFTYGTVELRSAKLVSMENEDQKLSRSQYVARNLRTKYTVSMTYAEVNSGKDSTYSVTLVGYAFRKVVAEDAIAKVTVEDKKREVIDDNTEKVSFTEVISMTSGETIRNEKSMFLNREFKGIAAYDKYVSEFSYTLESVNGISNGKEEDVKSADGWTVFGRTDKYSANISNGVKAELIGTDYSLYHERCIFKNEHISVDFGYEAIDVKEAKDMVSTAVSDKSGYGKAVYNNEIRTIYIGYVQNIAESVNLYKAERAISNYEFRNGKLVVNNNAVLASVDFVSIYNDGSEEVEKISKTFNRSLKCTSNWKANESNANQSTSGLNAKVSGEDEKSENGWKWFNQTRSISSTVKLAGSIQTNSWVSVDANKISYTREGKTFTFEVLSFNVSNVNDEAKLASETEELNTYAYSNTIAVSYGNNVVNTTASGQIMVEKEVKGDFPSEWGKFTKAVCTVSYNESKSDWLYTWSIHFEKGTLPVVVGKRAETATIDQSLFEYDTNDKLNGAVFKDNKWRNSIATDEKNYMLWSDTHSTALGALVYPTATCWGWNNEHNTVHTDAFTFSVENNGKTLIVKKGDRVFASYKASAR